MVPRVLGLELNDSVRQHSSGPEEFIQEAKSLSADGHTVVWLCDPFWGKDKERDRPWLSLLTQLRETYGVIFAYVGGNSRRRGDEKFDFMKVIDAPTPPQLYASENTCAYGLYLTGPASALLGLQGPES